MPPKNKPARRQIALAVAGACGRMGRAVLQAANAAPDMRVALAFMPEGDPSCGGQCEGITVAAEGALKTAKADVLIDFTNPKASLRFARVCAARGMAMVVGSTGFAAREAAQLRRAAAKTPILLAGNMSVGVNAMYAVAAFAARQLQAGALGGGYDMEVLEAHHRHKTDAPSGTALQLGQELARATGGNLRKSAKHNRHGRNLPARKAADIGFAVVRGGGIVGEHRVLFAGDGETMEITHRSFSRANYANGALRAARFVCAARPAFYDGMAATLKK